MTSEPSTDPGAAGTKARDEAQRAEPGGDGDRGDDALAIVPNGAGAAAILAAGVGALALGVFALIGDVSPAARDAFNIWSPSGPLSGVTTSAVVVWGLAWALLSLLWNARRVDLARVNLASFAMLITGLMLTFPPFVDLLQGK